MELLITVKCLLSLEMNYKFWQNDNEKRNNGVFLFICSSSSSSFLDNILSKSHLFIEKKEISSKAHV